MATATAINSQRHPYMRPEMWVNGKLAFYLNSGAHQSPAYLEFHDRMKERMAKLNKGVCNNF